jgi:hypothetical protein
MKLNSTITKQKTKSKSLSYMKYLELYLIKLISSFALGEVDDEEEEEEEEEEKQTSTPIATNSRQDE